MIPVDGRSNTRTQEVGAVAPNKAKISPTPQHAPGPVSGKWTSTGANSPAQLNAITHFIVNCYHTEPIRTPLGFLCPLKFGLFEASTIAAIMHRARVFTPRKPAFRRLSMAPPSVEHVMKCQREILEKFGTPQPPIDSSRSRIQRIEWRLNRAIEDASEDMTAEFHAHKEAFSAIIAIYPLHRTELQRFKDGYEEVIDRLLQIRKKANAYHAFVMQSTSGLNFEILRMQEKINKKVGPVRQLNENCRELIKALHEEVDQLTKTKRHMRNRTAKEERQVQQSQEAVNESVHEQSHREEKFIAELDNIEDGWDEIRKCHERLNDRQKRLEAILGDVERHFRIRKRKKQHVKELKELVRKEEEMLRQKQATLEATRQEKMEKKKKLDDVNAKREALLKENLEFLVMSTQRAEDRARRMTLPAGKLRFAFEGLPPMGLHM